MKLFSRIQKIVGHAMIIGVIGATSVTTCFAEEVTTSSEQVEESTTTEEGDMMPPDKPDDKPGEAPGTGGFDVESGSSVETTGVYEVDGEETTISNIAINATNSNESCIKATNGAIVTIKDLTAQKISGEMTVEEASDFFGANAGILVNEGSTANINAVAINTTASGGNAVFSTGEGTVVNISNTQIKTTKDHSRGLDATYGGVINADHISISTEGAHCAAVATDRGEGTITVKESSLNTSGQGSPCIYSTGNISAYNSSGSATGSSIAVIEGKNSITLENCALSGYGIGRTADGIDSTGVMIYQSMSGDANVGVGSFSAKYSTLTIDAASETYTTAPMFFVTNTDAEISLENTVLQYGSGILLKASGNDGEWGTAGANAGNVNLTATQQNLTGEIQCDEISTVDLSLNEYTTLTSTVDAAHTGTVSIALDETSKWVVTGDSYVSALINEDETLSNIISNGNTIYYDANHASNEWLSGETIELSDGGQLVPFN